MEYNSDQIRAYMAAIIESSDDAIIGKNLDGYITSWNPSAQRIFGYTSEEAVGKHITLIIPKEREDEEFIILGKVKSGSRVEHFETIRRAKDGTFKNISLTVSPIRDKSGKVMGISKIARDITEQKRTEIELRESHKRKDEFVANMSHELRTPMNAIIGLSGILALSNSLSPKEKQYIETIKLSANNMMDLINNLLDFSKLESGAIELESVEFSLAEIIRSIVRVTHVKAEEKGLPLRVSYAPNVREFYIGDSLRLQQAITNLVSNAVKFTNQGSVEINIRSEVSRGGKSVIVIDVVDTGIGISEDKVESIFNSFVQADASTSRKFGGSGLGLSISRAFVENMGGTISVRSRLGLGSTFTLRVPLQHSLRDDLIAHVSEKDTNRQKHVLVVDDYAPNLMVVAAMLDMLGYTYDSAENGLDAVSKFQENDYQVVLMDVQMPEMDGYESTRRMRMIESDQACQRSFIVAMTAHVQDADKQRCLDVGMDEFISKPFEITTLTEMLAKLIKVIDPIANANAA